MMTNKDPVWRYIEEIKKQSADEKRENRETMKEFRSDMKLMQTEVRDLTKAMTEAFTQVNVNLAEYGQIARNFESSRIDVVKRIEHIDSRTGSTIKEISSKIDEIDKAQQATLLMATKNNHTSKIVTYIGGLFAAAVISQSIASIVNDSKQQQKQVVQIEAKKQ
jgi:hypothetical protein